MNNILSHVHLYGLLIGLSVYAAISLLEKIIKKYKIPNTEKAIVLVLIFGFFGARMYHVITDFSLYYPDNLINIFSFWNGGMGIYGGVVGGVLGFVLWYTFFYKIKQYSILFFLDLFASILPLSQSIGRWGNFVNQELYGLPTTLPIGIYISPEHRLKGFEAFATFHPLFLYESVVLFLLWIFLWKKTSNNAWKLGSGKSISTYMIGYGLLRFFLDFLRIYPSRLGIFTVSQWVSLLFVIVGIFVIVRGCVCQIKK